MATERRQVGVSFVDPDSIVIESHMGSRGRSVLMGLVLAGIVLLVYLPALWGRFIHLDDVTVVQNMPLRSATAGLKNIWIHPIVSPRYQPMAYSLLVAEFKVFGTTYSGGYLAVNVLLHVCNVVLLWVLLCRVELPGALAAALLFGLHPMNVQAVGWISQQPLLLCGTFSLLTMLVWLRLAGITSTPPDTGKIFRLPETKWMLYVLVVLLLGCALASHVIAVALPVVMGVLIWWERARIRRAEVLAILPLAAMSAVWAAVTWIADSRRAAGTSAIPGTNGWEDALARLGASWGYLWGLGFPTGLSFIYPKGSAVLVMATIMGIAIIAVLSITWLLRPRVGRGPFAAALVVLALLVPTLIFQMDLGEWSHRADQLFYLPGAVLIIAIVGVAALLVASRPKWFSQALTVVAAVIFAGLTLVRLGDFRTSQRLWESVLGQHPDSVLALNNLGQLELEERNFAQARERFRSAMRADPDDLRPLLNLAHSYELEGNIDKMIERYQEALAKAPEDLEVHLGLGSGHAAKGNHRRAIEEFNFVLSKSPQNYQAVYRLGLAYRGMGDLDRAIEQFDEAIKLNPAEAAPYIDLANIAFAREGFESAVKLLDMAARVDPRNFRIFVNAGAQYGTLAHDPRAEFTQVQRNELSDRAETFLRYAVHLNPNSAEARYNLGGLLFNRGKGGEAVFQLTKAVQLSPQNQDFKKALKLVQESQQAAGVR